MVEQGQVKKDDDAKAKAEADKKAAEKKEADKKPTVKHFTCRAFSGLTILKEDGSKAHFTPYFDTYKGDKVRVGFLATDDPEVVKRCEASDNVESISEKEYSEATGSLNTAPVYSV